jgi:hypothetical protein
MMEGIIATETTTEVTTATAGIATCRRHYVVAKVAGAAVYAAGAYLHGCMATAAKTATATGGTAAAPGAAATTTVAEVLCVTAQWHGE